MDGCYAKQQTYAVQSVWLGERWASEKLKSVSFLSKSLTEKGSEEEKVVWIKFSYREWHAKNYGKVKKTNHH